jgi:hypothetical protein
VASASSPTTFDWQVSLGPTESLTQLADGSVAVVAPWPTDVLGPDDGTDYTSSGPAPAPQPLPSPDPYEFSADPDGSMAADEAMHNMGPFDPAYADEYIPDFGIDDPSDPDSLENANSGPPPGPDTSDPTDPSDDELVAESDGHDALYAAEESRSDQVVALIAPPHAVDNLGNTVPSSLSITAPDTVKLTVGPVVNGPQYPLLATSGISFNSDADTSDADLTPADAPSLARCTNVARNLVYTERGNRTLVNSLAHRPGRSICHYIALEPSLDAEGYKIYWPPQRVQFVHNKNTRAVTQAGSKFVAVARIDWGAIGPPGADPYVIGKKIRQNMYNAGFRAGSPQEDTWVINEIPVDIFTSPGRRNRLIRLVHGLYFGPRGFRPMRGFVFKAYAHHNDAYPYGDDQPDPFARYKSKWESLLERTSFWLPDQPPTTNARSIAPYVRWWSEETFTYCWLVCVPGARFDGTTSPPGNTKVHKTNEYLEHPARLAFAGPGSAGEARRLFDHGYMPLINTYWAPISRDPTWQTGYLSARTMLRFSSLQIYAAHWWADHHRYPDRRISLAWSEGETAPQARRMLAARLATSLAGGYSRGGTALDVCPGRRKVECNPALSADERTHYPPPQFIWQWETYFRNW